MTSSPTCSPGTTGSTSCAPTRTPNLSQRLAELLEERGDVDGAISVYRQAGEASVRRGNTAVKLARLLARHDRYDDAIEVMRALADAPGGAEDWIVDVLCTLYADHGRPQDALSWLDDLKARRGKEEWELFWIRLPLMAACGRVDEAVELTRAHPEGSTSYAAEHVATLLANAGRTEDAVTVLERYAPANASTLAGCLIDLGRVTDALALLQHTHPPPSAVPTTPLWLDEPPF
ncbi:tetratricopeptide repeat protein [Streptomyces halstedii]|uniref:tetratricopeptide repeat protein n=1 Tax=Streptomyces halstedii TaxID=1944 RepID=UPI00367C4D5A